MNIENLVEARIQHLGGKIDGRLVTYWFEKSEREILDFCNIVMISDEANIYLLGTVAN